MSVDNVGIYVGPHVWDEQVILRGGGLKSGYFEKLGCVKKGKRLSEMWTALPSISSTYSWLVPLPLVSSGAEC